jgi:hypothetical protein
MNQPHEFSRPAPAPQIDLFMIRDKAGVPSHGRVVVMAATGQRAECALKLPELRELSEGFAQLVATLERQVSPVSVRGYVQ